MNPRVFNIKLKSISFVDAGNGAGGDNEHDIYKNSEAADGWDSGEKISDPVWDADTAPDDIKDICYNMSTPAIPSRIKVDVAIDVESDKERVVMIRGNVRVIASLTLKQHTVAILGI